MVHERGIVDATARVHRGGRGGRLADRGGATAVIERLPEGYEALLDAFAGDETVWHALPKEAAAWWRSRAASTIRRHGDSWTVDGPASDSARVSFAEAGSMAARSG